MQSTGPTSYVGTTTTPANVGNACTHPVGQQMWMLTGSGASYPGTHVGFWLSDCSDNPGSATFTITENTPGTLTLVVDNGYTPRPTYTKPGTLVTPTPTPTPSPTSSVTANPPEVWITAPSGLIRQRNGGVSFEVVIHVRGGGDLVNGQVNVYDGNNLQPLTYKYGPIYDNRGTDTRTAPFSFKPRDGAPSAYFVCGYAIISAGGITSVNAPWSSCSWLRVDQVLYGRWTNRKTCASPDDPMGAASWMTSVRAYGGERVDFRDACGVRDSGYRGIVVQEPVTGKWYDFRTWSRAQVDQLFHQLLDLACRTQIPNSRRYAAARSAFLPYFDADLTAAGIQVSTNPAALPQGVSGTTPDRCAWAPGWSSARASM